MLSSHFNDGTHSDITIKFSGREVKAHKIILCMASPYFDNLCSPWTHNTEGQKATLHIPDDIDPAAVEAMLRYIYGYDCARIAQELNGQHAQFHFHVLLVARKFSLPRLEEKAVQALLESNADIELAYYNTGDISHALNLLKLLCEYKHLHGNFLKVIKGLCNNHLVDLMAEREFRGLMDGEDGKTLLDFVLTAVKAGQGSLRVPNVGILTCVECATSRAPTGALLECPDCHKAMVHSRWA